MRALCALATFVMILALHFPDLIAGEELSNTPSIGEKFEWCSRASSPLEKVARYELFWEHYHPKDEEYDDDIQGRLVRRCAYRLADLYVQMGDTSKGA
jgi:hypothetical protein